MWTTKNPARTTSQQKLVIDLLIYGKAPKCWIVDRRRCSCSTTTQLQLLTELLSYFCVSEFCSQQSPCLRSCLQAVRGTYLFPSTTARLEVSQLRTWWCAVGCGYRRFEGSRYLHLQGLSFLDCLNLGGEGTVILRNDTKQSTTHQASYRGRPERSTVFFAWYKKQTKNVKIAEDKIHKMQRPSHNLPHCTYIKGSSKGTQKMDWKENWAGLEKQLGFRREKVTRDVTGKLRIISERSLDVD